MTLPIVGWTLGTFLGAFAAELLPPIIQACMGIALYCMFIALIVPPATDDRFVLVAVLISIAMSCMFKYVPGINVISQNGGGWSMIISAVAAAAICATFLKRKNTVTDQGKEAEA